MGHTHTSRHTLKFNCNRAPRRNQNTDKETHIQADIHLHLIATGPRGETRMQIKKHTCKQTYT